MSCQKYVLDFFRILFLTLARLVLSLIHIYKYSNPHSLDNLSSSIEYALVNWKMADRFTLTVGKRDIDLGGYEYSVNAIKVR